MRQASELMTSGQYLPVVELSPEIAIEVAALREESWQLIEDRQSLIDQNRYDEVPLTIDALSTAETVVKAREGGETSYHYKERRSALVLDCLRLAKEWNRKLKPEVFGELRHHYSQPDEEFYSHGLALGQMTQNSLRPIESDPEEEARRVNERVEDRLPIIIQKTGGIALGGVGIRTISQCTRKAVIDFEKDRLEQNPHSGYGGYVPEIEKTMIRDIRIDPETGDRIQTQIGVPSKYTNTHEVFVEVLRRKGVDASDMDKTEIHGLQLLVDDDLKDFQKLLDQVASEEWCVPIFMGERVDADHPRDYDAFWQEAEQRETELLELAEKTATFLIDLVDDNFDKTKAPAHVEEFVKLLLLDKAKDDITIAHNAFGEKTAQGIKEVLQLEKNGQYEDAFQKMLEVEKAAPGGGFCGAGSCGLESVNLSSVLGQSYKKSLKAEDGDTIVKDKERACKCGKKGTVVYAYNPNKVNKWCTSCHSFESKTTK
jgi:hypothetical protein